MLDITSVVWYNSDVRRGQPLMKGGRNLEDMATATESLLRAILELINKCETLEELRESVKRIMGDEK